MDEGREDLLQEVGHSNTLRIELLLLVANKILAWRGLRLGYSGGETCYTVSLRSVLGRV
jgi:hypothetical protein